MDASTSLRKSRKKRKCLRKGRKKGKGEFKGEDRISSLPDGILHHILSFLPLHYAIHTSLLSKRWKCIWKGISKLDLCETVLYCDSVYKKINFINFVENVLLHHDPTVVIETFHLFYMTIIDEAHLTAWISTILNRKVQDIELHVSAECPIIFPSALFTCHSLTDIDLTAMLSTFELPCSVCFPNLKLWRLKFIQFSCGGGIQEVTFNFPVLEEFILIDCVWLKIKDVIIFAPKLERIVIDNEEEDDDGIYTNCEVKIYAESLLTLDVISGLTYGLSLCNVSSLASACINLSDGSHFRDRSNRLLEGMCSVKDLSLPYPTLRQFSDVKDLLILSNLKCLTVSQTNFVTREYLTELFCSLSSIESLCILHGLDQYCSDQGYDWTLGAIPQSFLSQLKSFEIGNFNGSETELTLVEFLLMNARSLEKITIVSSSALSAHPEIKLAIAKDLLSCPRGQLSCVIEFS
ncbi:hypothetical protein ACHQM5_008798 [Ranunculus cassubicifolius]